MPIAKTVKLLALNGLAIGLGAVVATSCVSVEYPTVAFRCNPRQSDNCPEDFFCCSDDPAQLDGQRLFSGLNNDLSNVGMCVQNGSIPAGSGLIELPQCPVPCNPQWDASQVANACGANRVCCQTVEITANDCILDGNAYRPARGQDVLDGLSTWAPTQHDTHQDPNGKVCLEISGGDQTSNLFKDCVRSLGVADTRGFCMQLGPGQGCPTDNPAYLSACDKLNMGIPP